MKEIRSRLALFLGQADEYFQSRFIRGFTERAFEQNTDICVFSMFKKYEDAPAREAGDANILKLANPNYFEGIVILKDTIQTEGAAQELEECLHKSFEGPVLVIDAESKYYPDVFIDGYESVRMLTSHLIDVHGATDIAYLSGKRWHRHSLERMAGLKDELESRGLSLPENRIIEGDFWYQSGERCVDYLTAEGQTLPQALVCANDQMAIGACKAFEVKGIRVPEDIIVVGCDSTIEGQCSPKSITSYLTPAHECGRYAVDWILDQTPKKEPLKFSARSRLMAGESCGCCDPAMPAYSLKRTRWDTEISLGGYDAFTNAMFEDLMGQGDVQDYISTLYSYAYQIKDAACFHLMLAPGIRYMGQADAVIPGNDGYPEKMIHAIRYNNNRVDNIAGTDIVFETEQMLPDLVFKRELPTAFFFSPVFYEDKNFGYAVVGYNQTHAFYDDTYRRWLGTASRGFEALRRQLTILELEERLNKMKTGKFEKATAAYDQLSEEEKQDYNTVRLILDQNLFTYHFQPIVSAENGSIYSYEALMRSTTERRVSPLAIIKYAGMMERLAGVEWATFNNVMDIMDENRESISTKIFINSIPGVKTEDAETIGRRLSQMSDRIVVELTEEAQLGDDELQELKGFFDKANIEIAVDDYGTGYSNISNLLRYMPDYVKIDRALLSDIQNRPQKQHFVREIIEFCHENNIKALAEGIETAEELRCVIHLGADLIQGYYTAKPAPGFLDRIDESVIEEIRVYQQEKKDGKSKHTYIAGKVNRVALMPLAKDEITDIVIGQGEMNYKDITIVGMPSLKSEISIRVEPGYSGRITLENVWLSNAKDRPCISIGENADVVCVVVGDNTLKGLGVMVPESARFTLEGEGNLFIYPSHSDYYGIGNDISSRHGELIIASDGRLLVDARGNFGTCIGSGLGGKIYIKKGALELNANGDRAVAVGS
ncbi:MAG: EAL domain-containing protein, partial [Lachnospiraceae bacterium]|nr:EAL domain-containing protein [Lachnospiraceae bacterium]